MTRVVEFFHLLFTVGMIKLIVTHTNTYTNELIVEESHRCYAQKDGSWQDVTPDEIQRLIALLRFWSVKSLYHGFVG